MIGSLKHVASKLGNINLNDPKFLKVGLTWKSSPSGWVKLNVDGIFSTINGVGVVVFFVMRQGN